MHVTARRLTLAAPACLLLAAAWRGVPALPEAAAPQQVEFGITVAPSHQGQGYASEALHAVFGHLFGALGKHRVHASVDPRNDACIALLESVGMRREGHLRESLLVDGEWVDDLLYAVLRSEWEARS